MSGAAPPRFNLGGASVAAFKIGDLSLTLEEVFGPGPESSRYFDRPLSATEVFPNYSFLVTSGDVKVVVDPGEFSRLILSGHFRAPAGYVPPPLLVDQMKRGGVGPEAVTHVVVTHLHYDHFDGVTLPKPSGPALAFPNAVCIVPSRDWEMPSIAEARSKGDTDVTETLGVAEEAGLLELAEGERSLGGGITIEPFTGESPGHQVLAVRGGSGACYLVGDLYHMKEEVEHPELAAEWTDREAILTSRNRFASMAARESALVLPGHMLPGRIRDEGGRALWEELGRP